MPTITVDRAVVESELARYLADPPDDPPEAVAGAARHHVLPLFSDFMGCWALRPSGELVFFAWEEPDRLTSVSDHPVERPGVHVALAVGSRRYPSLACIRPERTADAIICRSCDGSGRIPGTDERIVCACAGLGWTPPVWSGSV